ncbi:MAG: signal peptidase I [Lachnospiraceae bacterium]|nr:signal peptidase I [Lachnospiraceae bacterium]
MENKDMNTNEVLEAEKQPEKKNTWKEELISWIQVLASAAAIAFVLTTFIIANSEVPTGSMENTIMAGSRVIGSRLHYKFSEPERGDVAIFVWGWGHKDCRTMFEGEEKDTCPRCGTEVGRDTETIYYVKRIIGLEGDTIDIVDGKVYLNGSDTPLEEPYLAEEMDPDETYHFEVPEDCYFMMGDNRNYSADARYWRNPYISKDKMIAKVLVEYFPTPKIIK